MASRPYHVGGPIRGRPRLLRLLQLLVGALLLLSPPALHPRGGCAAEPYSGYDYVPNRACRHNSGTTCWTEPNPSTGFPTCWGPLVPAGPGGACPAGWFKSTIFMPDPIKYMGCVPGDEIVEAMSKLTPGELFRLPSVPCDVGPNALLTIGDRMTVGICPPDHQPMGCWAYGREQSQPACYRVYDCVYANDTSSPPPPAKKDNCTLGSILDKGSQCGTYAVIGLTRQIAAEIALLNVTLVALTPEQAKHVNCLSAEGCTGLLNPDALNALIEAAKARGKPITLTSMWRSAAQQYLLYQHKALGICNQINPVSRPGNSNHEGGTGIDVDGTGRQAWKKALKDVGWKHLSGDPPHFFYLNKKDPNTKYSLMAFQRLWNRHNPTAKVAEDGKYNSETAEALRQAPCQGW